MQMAYYTEGAVPSAGGKFKEKENALENQYMRQQDALKLKKLQEQLEAAQQSVDSVKKELQEHVEKNNKN
ncbi:hypothetical protein IWQ62_003293 [Dispira parvispora]|uniref:ATPase inhibitor, mitochondrial n=1 Tax=Dispira parvispora TaxID=1520584 RepID=A0A9W8E768_9FUNG|nr:hypothetical protein IWQ62_003293 [Dispira parvispora]